MTDKKTSLEEIISDKNVDTRKCSFCAEEIRVEAIRCKHCGSNLAKDDMVECPKCGSNNIFIGKKGYDASAGCCGALLLGPFGLLCGQTGANKIEKTCLNCKHKWQ